MPQDEIEKNEPAEVVETVVEQPAAEEVKQWAVVDDKPEVHPSFLEQPKEEVVEVIEKVVEVPAEEKPAEEKPAEQPIAPLVIDENVILKELNEKYGFKAKSLDDLKPKEIAKLNSKVEAFKKFVEDTNNDSLEAFMATQKDWATEPKENILLQNLRLENPTLTDKQIDRLYQKEYVASEFADEDEITDKEINIEKDYQKGLALLEGQKEKYKVVKGLDESIPEDFKKAKEFTDSYIKQQEENKVAFEQNTKDFQFKTDEVFSSNFEGFKVKVGNEKDGFEEFVVNPDDVQETKKTLSDLSNFDKKFFDESGKLKDAPGYYKALHFAMNPDKVADHFIKIGMAKQLEIEEKESKNIIVDGVKNIQTGSTIKPWKVEEEK
jgi:hypothetical protein